MPSSSRSAAEFATRSGRIRPLLVGAAVLLAVIALFRTALPDGWAAAGGLILVAAAAGSLKARRNHRIRLPDAGPARLDGAAGTLGGVVVTPWFVSLELRTPAGDRKRAALFRDELDEEDFRSLLSYLRNG